MKADARPARRTLPRPRSLAGLALLLGLCFPAGGSRAAALTFPEALSALRARNGHLQAAAAEVAQRQEERLAARGLYFPRIEAHGNAVRLDSPLQLDFEGISQMLRYVAAFTPGFPLETIPHLYDQIEGDHYVRADVSGSWTVFAGGRLRAANGAAAARLDEARARRAQLEEGLSTELVRRYFGLRLARQSLAVRAAMVEELAGHLAQTRQLVETGRLPEAERLQAEIALDAAERARKRDQHELTAIQAGLCGLLAADDSVDAASPLFVPDAVEPLEHFLALARGGNRELARLDANERLAEASGRMATSAWFPEIYLFGKHELRYTDLTELDPKWSAGVGAQWTLFDGGARWRSGRASRQERIQTRDDRTQEQRDLEGAVSRDYQELLRESGEFHDLGRSVQTAREGLRLRRQMFLDGRESSTAVSDAAGTYFDLLLDRLTAAFAFDVDLAELLGACGASEQFEQYRNRTGPEVESGS